MTKNHVLIGLLCLFSMKISAQTVLPLYDGPIPNQKAGVKASLDSEVREGGDKNGILRIKNITMPSLTVYRPAQPNGTAVIICPGGGYYILAAGHEGSDVAQRFTQMGVTAFVLKYRLPTTGDSLGAQAGGRVGYPPRPHWYYGLFGGGAFGFYGGYAL
jgi:hypothetical protein